VHTVPSAPTSTTLSKVLRVAQATAMSVVRSYLLSYLYSMYSPANTAPLEKLTSLIEDIFEAEDALPPDADPSTLPADFFSTTSTTDFSRPLLQPSLIRKLTKYIGYVSRPNKRLRTAAGAQGTPKGKGRMAEVDTQVLSRLLKLLERNVRAGEDVDPFPSSAPSHASKSVSPQKKSPKKSTKVKKNDRRSRSRTPGHDEGETEDWDGEDRAEADELSESDFDKLTRMLDIARDSIFAADCCIALLASDRLTKQVCRIYTSILQLISTHSIPSFTLKN
jgi:cohesin loading factor subunit SCC2